MCCAGWERRGLRGAEAREGVVPELVTDDERRNVSPFMTELAPVRLATKSSAQRVASSPIAYTVRSGVLAVPFWRRAASALLRSETSLGVGD
jgi:hypothetical protein